jgi:signal peptide peptidase SppA
MKTNNFLSTNLLAQYNYNKGKVILATQDFYSAFKSRMEATINTKADFLDTLPDTYGEEVPYTKCGSIAVLDFQGFVVPSCSELEEAFFGLISLQDFCEDLQQAVNDESVTQVVINFNSGGGYTMYGEETSDLIQSLKQIKPIYAYTSGLMCSMAYKVACNCTGILASPSSLVGSIGVYCEYVDYTKMLDIQGIVVKTFQGGSEKTIGSPYISLTPDQEKEIQDDINQSWQEFKDVVTANRGPVKQEFMQGQSFKSKEAITEGTNLIDGNINSIGEFLNLLSSSNN